MTGPDHSEMTLTTSAVFGREIFGYPSDTAMGVLCSSRSGSPVLYLTDAPLVAPDFTLFNGALRARIEAPSGVILQPPSPGDAGRSRFADSLVNRPHGLPLADDALGLIVISLTGTWARSRTDMSLLIMEANRVLPPEGELLIVTGNGLSYAHLIRVIKGFWRAQGPLGKLKGIYSGLRKVLRRMRSFPDQRKLHAQLENGGFASIEWFRPTRDRAAFLREIRPLFPREDMWVEDHPLRHPRSLRSRPKFADEFIVRAASGPLQHSVLSDCLRAAARALGTLSVNESGAHVERFRITPKEKIVMMVTLGATRAVLRIPLSIAALNPCQRNLQTLRAIANRTEKQGPWPRVIWEGEVSGYYCTVETALSGKPILRNGPRGSDLVQVEAFLDRLNPQSSLRREVLDGQLYEDLVAVPLRTVSDWLGDADRYNRLNGILEDRLRGCMVSVGITHGDLSLNNIFAESGEITGIIDWDDSCLAGIPVCDAISHLCSRHIRRGNRLADTLLALASRKWPEGHELQFLERAYARSGIDPGLHPELVLLFWLHVVRSLAGFRYTESATFRKTRVDSIVDLVVEGVWPFGEASSSLKAVPDS